MAQCTLLMCCALVLPLAWLPFANSLAIRSPVPPAYTRAEYLQSATYAALSQHEVPRYVAKENHTFVDQKTTHMEKHVSVTQAADGCVLVRGYQRYRICPKWMYYSAAGSFPAGAFFQPSFMAGNTYLDVGANDGAWCAMALYCGAKHVTGVEMDPGSIRGMESVKKFLNIDNWSVFSGKLGRYPGKADVVTAIGVLHWLCGHSEGDSLENAILNLRRVTRKLLLVEWVDPRDDRVRLGNIKVFNARIYTMGWFRLLLTRHFTDWVLLADTSRYDTIAGHHRSSRHRGLYAASVGFSLRDILAWPMRTLLPRHPFDVSVIPSVVLNSSVSSGLPPPRGRGAPSSTLAASPPLAARVPHAAEEGEHADEASALKFP
eukprot:RCo054102